MIFPNELELYEHYELLDKHAPFSPSQHFWINYPPERLLEYWDSKDAQIVGTHVHEGAAELIRLEYYFREHKLPYHISLRGKDSFSLHVMHSIKNLMQPEVAVKYSDICFGHADALGFNIPTRTLRINDLKTGKRDASFDQLEQYAAIFFAEYASKLQYELQIDLPSCKVELRIFQHNQENLVEPPIEYILNEVLPKIRNQHAVLADMLARREM